jgi:hypothetical protein
MTIKKIGVRDAGAAQSKGHSDKNRSSDEELFIAIRAELDGKADITSPDATDLASVILLSNELKAALNVAGTFEK